MFPGIGCPVIGPSLFYAKSITTFSGKVYRKKEEINKCLLKCLILCELAFGSLVLVNLN
jgi:hypothetical protein